MREDRTSRALDEMEEIVLRIAEEQHASAAARGFDGVGELHAARFERGAGGFDGIDPERHVPPASERVDGCLLQGQFGLVDFEHEPAGETEKEGGRRLAIVENQFGAENAEVPVLQRQGIAGGQAEVFDGELHAEILGGTRSEGTENAGKSAMTRASVQPQRVFERPINRRNIESTRGKGGRADARLTPGCTSVRLRH